MSQLTVTQAAKSLGVSRQAVLKLVASGALPSIAEKRGTRVFRHLIPASAVADRLDSIEAPAGHIGVVAAAYRLGVDPTTVRRWITDGKLPAVESPSGRRFVVLAAARLVARGGTS
jgi:excisionase family DNA binding protein